MKKKIVIIIFFSICSIFTKACVNQAIDQKYKTQLQMHSTHIKNINIKEKLINAQLFIIQIQKIKEYSPSLYFKNKDIYNSIIYWMKKNYDFNTLNQYGINAMQMHGIDKYKSIKITGYYTPIIEARKFKINDFKYPIYSMPLSVNKNILLPKRKDIYNGILNKKYILAYSNSLINNFIMEIQGSAFINYGNNKPLVFFSYSGKNGWPYKSIGQILINQGEIKQKNMSMTAIKEWCQKHTEKEVQNLFEKNESFVFFKETKQNQVYGSSSVPLIAQTAIAADQSIVQKGSVILLKIPLLNKNGIFTKKYEIRLVVALDVGGAIKGQHFDFYQGIGEKAGVLAGFYNHYGYAWILTNHKNFNNKKTKKNEYYSIRNYS